jgi:RNA polymerase sigma-54 factor
MDIGLKQEQRLQLGLRMTLQLQQAIKLLQLSRFELENAITNELMENPVLEEVQTAPAAGPVAAATEAGGDSGTADYGDGGGAAEAAQGSGEFDWSGYFDRYASGRPEGAFGRPDRDEDPRQERRLLTKIDLRGHLLWQLRLSDFDDSERDAGVYIIESLDEDGLLPPEEGGDVVAEIAAAAGVTPEKAESVLKRIQQFDPVGVASRSVRECLKIQADTLAPSNRLIHDILDHHYDAMNSMKFSAIARALGTSEEEVREAVRIISRFDTRPGRNLNQAEPQYVIPDVFIEKDKDGYRIVMNDDGIPRVRISRYYREYLKNHKRDDASRFIKERLNSAVWFLNSLDQRRRTIYKVTEAIINLQRDFFDRGVDLLKPMYLRDVAREIGMHESTVCRVTANKYVHTPQGLYEMKFFFNSGVGTAEGTDMASTAVKSRMARLLQEEGGSGLSDREIVAMLARDGIKIARRTVAKYRSQLGIMTSSKRRKML